MSFEITGHDDKKQEAICSVVSDAYGIDMFPDGKGIYGSGEYTLAGGQTEDEFAQEATLLVWKANGKPCRVSIMQYYLEDPPCTLYEYTEDDGAMLSLYKAQQKES
jgi:hypothetical protein